MLSSRQALFFFQAEDGIRDLIVTGVQTCALPILGTYAGFTCEESHAAASVTMGRVISAQSTAASLVRRIRRVKRGERPTTQAARSTTVTRSPPSTWREIRIGVPRPGFVLHGAAVCAAW